MEPPARRALDDLSPLKLRKSSQHGQRQLVLGIFNVILPVNDDLFSALTQFVDDDGLICDLAGNAIGAVEIDRVEQIGFQISSHLIKGGAIKQLAANSVVDVFLDEYGSAASICRLNSKSWLSIVPSFS